MNNHLSASQRKILTLEARVAELEQMQKEYNAFLNYIVSEHGSNGVYTLYGDKLRTVEIMTIRTEIEPDVEHGQRMTISRVGGSNHTANRLITS